MIAAAAKITIDIQIDIDTLKPSLSADVDIMPGFEFLTGTPNVLASWIHTVADSLAEKSDDE